MIIDTHTHFYDPSRPQGVPWPARNDCDLYRTVLPAAYKALAQPLGVAGTVVVEASPWLEDNQWLLDLAEADPFLLGVVGNLDPREEAFPRHLARFAVHPKFKGLRIGGRVLAEMERGPVLDHLAQVAEAGLALDLLVQQAELPRAAELPARVPGLRVVIDHVGNLKIDGRQPPAVWREAMARIADHPRACCKVSGLAENTGRRPAPMALDFHAPVLEALWGLFGPERLIYGSNWPVCEPHAPYPAVQGLAAAWLADKGPAAVRAVLAENARRVYRLTDS